MATLMFNSQEMAIKQLFHQSGECVSATVAPNIPYLLVSLLYVLIFIYYASVRAQARYTVVCLCVCLCLCLCRLFQLLKE